MCIVFLSTGYHHGYKLIILNNRDEVLDRPTKSASFWENEDGNIIAGFYYYYYNHSKINHNHLKQEEIFLD